MSDGKCMGHYEHMGNPCQRCWNTTDDEARNGKPPAWSGEQGEMFQDETSALRHGQRRNRPGDANDPGEHTTEEAPTQKPRHGPFAKPQRHRGW